MKNVFFVFAVLVFSSTNLCSQSDLSNGYIKTTEGPFYVVMEADASVAEETKRQLTELNEEKGVLSKRVSILDMVNINFEKFYLVVVRRFENHELARDYIKLVDDHAKFSAGQAGHSDFSKELSCVVESEGFGGV